MRVLGLLGLVAVAGLGALACGSDSNGGNGAGAGGTGPGAGGSGAGGTGTGAGGSAAGMGGSAGSAGAGGSAGGSTMFACDYANYSGSGFHWCWTWDASNLPSPAAVLGIYQMSCTQGMGTPVAACSGTGAVGKCTFTSMSGAYSVSQSVWYYAPIDRAVAMQACMVNNAGGVTATWTPL